METPQTNTGHSYLDVAFTFLMVLAGYAAPNLLHIHMPVLLMEFTQWAAWIIAITAGILTIMNHLGYVPGWLAALKSKLKR